MSSILFRTADLTPGTGRTVHGIGVPYNQIVTVDDGDGPYRERFEYGAFARSIRERGAKVKLLANHDHRQFPIGKAVELVEERDGLRVAFDIAATRAGDDVLELIQSGIVDGFSVGFRGIREQNVAGVRVRTEVSLREVSLTAYPAYSGAAVGGVRSQQLVIPRDVAERRLRLLEL